MSDNRFCPLALIFTILVLVAPTRGLAQSIGPLDEEGRVVNFNRDIVPIFRESCGECHTGEDAKADFFIDDVDSVMNYVEAGDPKSSDLIVDYLTSEDPDMLMPPESHGGPLSPAELALIQLWIQEGADWPEDATDQVTPAAATPAERSLLERVWSFQGFFHPATVHFPIAMFLVGAFFVVLSWKWPMLGTQIPLACLLIGTATAIVASAMGWSFAVEKGYGSWAKVDFDNEEGVFWHRWSAIIVTLLSIGLTVIAFISLRSRNPRLERTWKAGLLVLAAIVGAVGHQGGELTYGKDLYPKAFRILLGQPDPKKAETAPVEAANNPTPLANFQ